MKRIIVLITICLLLGGCQSRSKEYLVITKVELSCLNERQGWKKYKVTVEDDFDSLYPWNHAIYTDSIYTAGDTIKLTR